MTIADSLGRAIVHAEVLRLIGLLQIPESLRYDAIRRARRREGSATEVESVERGSWVVQAIIHAGAVVAATAPLLLPSVKKAYEGSRVEHAIFDFLRNRVFGGASPLEAAQDEAAKKPNVGNLIIDDVTGETVGGQQSVIVKVRRTKPPKPQVPQDIPNDMDAFIEYLQKLNAMRPLPALRRGILTGVTNNGSVLVANYPGGTGAFLGTFQLNFIDPSILMIFDLSRYRIYVRSRCRRG
jgi:hypothetical protein